MSNIFLGTVDLKVTKKLKNDQKLRKKILIVSSFPPKHCGIATYACQQKTYFENQGYIVDVITPYVESGSKLGCDFRLIGGMCKGWLQSCVGQYHAVYVHFTDGLIWPKPLTVMKPQYIFLKIVQVLLFAIAGLALRIRGKVIVHEFVQKGSKGILWLYLRALGFSCWQELQFHSEENRTQFAKVFKNIVSDRLVVAAHSRYMIPHFFEDKVAARKLFEIPIDVKIILFIGFLQPSKGIAQLLQMLPEHLSMNFIIVGSFKSEIATCFREQFRDSCRRLAKVTFVEGYVSDTNFDAWIVAADALILPYQLVCSSSVAARAQLFQQKLICYQVPELMSQLKGYSRASFYRTKDEFINCINALDAPMAAKNEGLRELPKLSSQHYDTPRGTFEVT